MGVFWGWGLVELTAGGVLCGLLWFGFCVRVELNMFGIQAERF